MSPPVVAQLASAMFPFRPWFPPFQPWSPRIPTLHWLGQQDASRLATGPLRSPQRQAILHFLYTSHTAHSIKDILAATSYDQEAGRKMILRMRVAGELVSPACGLYTTADPPCLNTPPVTQSEPDSDTVPNVSQHFGLSPDLSYVKSIDPCAYPGERRIHPQSSP